jgi:hypothetical protein
MSTAQSLRDEAIATARDAILYATSTSELWQVGQDIAAEHLADDVLEELRGLYLEYRRRLQTTVKTETLSGKVLIVNRPRYVETATAQASFSVAPSRRPTNRSSAGRLGVLLDLSIASLSADR